MALAKSMSSGIIIAIGLLTIIVAQATTAINVSVLVEPASMTLQVGTSNNLSLSLLGQLNDSALLWFTYEAGGSKSGPTQPDLYKVIKPLPNITFSSQETSAMVTVTALKVASVVVALDSTDDVFKDLSQSYVHITVVHDKTLSIINIIIGWIYFAAWSISFYPQVFSNWRRKSVVGLNFDFLFYNLTGFIAYSLFNIGMYWIDDIKSAYHAKHPHGINPVQLSDVVFTLHAVAITAFTIIQCLIYDRGDQRVSRLCLVLQTVIILSSLTALFVAVFHVITWLLFLYYFSYVKLGISLIKYIPQAVMNYRRKSTSGWSIGNVLLDFTGGGLSVVQMFLISYNNDDWGSIFGDPTKFGLGFLSVLFDILFVVQHYVLYRKPEIKYEPLETSDSDQD